MKQTQYHKQQQQQRQQQQQQPLKTKQVTSQENLQWLRHELISTNKKPRVLQQLQVKHKSGETLDIIVREDGTIDKEMVQQIMLPNVHKYIDDWLKRREIHNEKQMKYSVAKNLEGEMKDLFASPQEDIYRLGDAFSKVLWRYKKKSFDDYLLNLKSTDGSETLLVETYHKTFKFRPVKHTGDVECLPVGSIVYYLEQAHEVLYDNDYEYSQDTKDKKNIWLPRLAMVLSHTKHIINFAGTKQERFVIGIEMINMPGNQQEIHAFRDVDIVELSVQKYF